MTKISVTGELQNLVRNLNLLTETLSNIDSHTENGLSHVPAAANRLDKVSQETEAATHHLIDILDELTRNDRSQFDLVTALQANGPDTQIMLQNLAALLDKNQQAHNKMLEILQFQDLTSQQIQYVKSILDRVEGELMAIRSVFDPASAQKALDSHAKGAFDPDAAFAEGPERQQAVDQYLKELDNER